MKLNGTIKLDLRDSKPDWCGEGFSIATGTVDVEKAIAASMARD